MPPEEINFSSFFAAKLKDRGISIKKVSEMTGIAPGHLEALAHGRYDELPSAPYLRGYLVRLGKALDFDGREWWEALKREGTVQNSGSLDYLPRNRFIRPSPAKFIWIGVGVIVIILYLAFQIPVIFGKPSLTVNFPDGSPYVTSSSTLTLSGFARSADSLYLSNGTSGDNETISLSSDGSWQKSVLLQNGPNTFQITAKKLLGGETNITEEIIYEGGFSAAPAVASGSGAAVSSTAKVATTTAAVRSAGVSASSAIASSSLPAQPVAPVSTSSRGI